MHTNILINSNFESFNYAQSDRWVLRFYFYFYSHKNMVTLHSQHNAYIHNCKSPDTHSNHDYGYENFELQLGANVRVVPKIVISLNKMKWIQIRTLYVCSLLFLSGQFWELIRMVVCLRFISFSFELGWYSVKVFACCNLCCLCVWYEWNEITLFATL